MAKTLLEIDERAAVVVALQDADQLRALRLEILAACREGGWLKEGTALADGIADPARRCTEGDLEYARTYHEVYKLESFHRAGHWPEVLATMTKVIGGMWYCTK